MVEAPVRPVQSAFSNGAESHDLVLPNGYVTWEGYLDYIDRYDDVAVEWEDGKLVKLPMPNFRHQDILGFLTTLIRLWIEFQELGGAFLPEGYPTRISDKRGRKPDALYISEERIPELTSKFLLGGADIAVEIVSEDGRKRDYQTKLFEYESAGVREYWIIDPEAQATLFYRLDETAKFRIVPLTGESETVFTSTVLHGFEMDTNWLLQEKLPAVRKIMETWQPKQAA